MDRANTQEDLELQQSVIAEGVEEVDNIPTDKNLPGEGFGLRNPTQFVKNNLQVSIYQNERNQDEEEEEKTGDQGKQALLNPNHKSSNNPLQKNDKVKGSKNNNFINLNEFDPILIGNSNTITPINRQESNENNYADFQSDFTSTKRQSTTSSKVPDTPYKPPQDLNVTAIKMENVDEIKRDNILVIVNQNIKAYKSSQKVNTRLQKIVSEIEQIYGASWGVSIVNKEFPSYFVRKYEYILVDSPELTYEIYRLRIDSDDLSQEEMKTLIKSNQIDDNIEMCLKDMIMECVMLTKNKEDRSKILQEKLDDKYGKYWVVAILDKETSLKYNYTHKHIRLRIEYQSFIYEMYKNLEFQPEDTTSENFRIISKAENITDIMVKKCRQFLQESFTETNGKFTNLRANILKKKFEEEYGVYWTVIICHRGSAFFNYFDKEHIKIQFRGLQYDIFRSCHMFDALQVDELTIIQKDKLMDVELENYITEQVVQATKKYQKPEYWKDRGAMIRNNIEQKYGQYWAVIISKTAIKNYSYFKNQFIRIKYKRVIYDIYRSSVQHGKN